MIGRSLLAALATAAGLLAWMEPAHAFRLVPIEMEFSPGGRGATQIVRLENDRSEPAAVELRMMARTMAPDGADQLTPADEQFVVFPEQLVLMPGQNQTVRVQWVGTDKPNGELAFRLIAEQLPVDLGKSPPQGGQVRLLVRYVASVYVVPPGAKPDVAITRVGAVSGPSGRQLEIFVANKGSAHQILHNPQLALTAGDRTLTLRGEQLPGLAGENVLAGTERRFVLPWPAGLGEGVVAATLTLPQ